jgi:hypothetical protein
MSKPFPVYIRMSDIADEVGAHPSVIEKCIYRDVIVPDAEITHGRSHQPIFLKSRLKELAKAVREYRGAMAPLTA